MIRTCIAIGVAVVLAAHGPRSSPVAGARPADGGYVALYVKPLPRAASGLTLTIESVSAVREDGSVTPLSLTLPDLAAGGMSRQRLLAWGILPGGSYAGFVIKARSASVKEEDGPRKLTISAETPLARLAFAAGPRKTLVATLDFDYGASRKGMDEMAPAFLASVPSKMAIGLTGVVASRSTGVLSLFDKVSGQIAAAIPVGRGPAGLVLDPARNRVYVALGGDDAVATIDLLGGSVLATAPLRGGDVPISLGLTQDGRILLVANAGSSTVTVFDSSGPTLVERSRVEVGTGPQYLLVDRAGTRAWVFCALEDAVTVMNLPSGLRTGSVPSPGGPVRGDFNRAGTRLYVLHKSSAYLDIVDTATLAVVQRVFVGPGAVAIKVDPQTDRIYLGFSGAKGIAIYDPTEFLPIDEIPTEGGAGFLTIDGQGNNLCVLDPVRGKVSLVRLVGKGLAALVDVPEPTEAVLLGER